MLNSAWAQPLPDGSVTIDGVLYRALIAEPEDEVDPRAKLVVQDRDVRLRWDGEVLRLRATWTVVPREDTWLDLPVAGPGVRVDELRVGGQQARRSVQGGWTVVTAAVSRPTTVVLEGAIEANPAQGPIALELATAVYGTVSVAAPEGLEGRVVAEGAVDLGGVFLTPKKVMKIQVGPPQRKARDRRTLAVASVGMGLTVGDGAVRGRAQARWALRQGELKQVSLRVAGVGADLEVTGSNVGRVQRQGDRVVITLREPERAVVDVDVRWSVPVPAGSTASLSLPTLQPEGAFRTEASLQLARDGEVEAIPEVPGWQAISIQSLPEWGDDLVEGTPTAAFTSAKAGRGGTLGLLRYVPVPAPPVMVDVASLTIAASGEGRTLTRANYTVRNERASHLSIRPPDGAIIVGARVQDGPVTPVSDGAAWLIPLPRSLETVDGLLSFPVEVVLIGDGTPWIRKEARDIPVPVVDAPIAVHRVTLHLPPVFENTLELGDAGTVADFTEGEGIAYGFGLGDEKEAEADQLWQDAQAAYMRNDFDDADELLDELGAIGASNENLGKLRSNLDIVQGRAGAKAKAVSARRVREQAKSRGMDDYRAQEDLLRKAEEELAAGNYEEADSAYKKVEKIASKLDKLEQAESYEQKARAAQARKGSSSANSGIQWQQAVGEAADAPSPDEASKEELVRVTQNRIEIRESSGMFDTRARLVLEKSLRDLENEATGEGLVTRAAEGKDLGGTTTTARFADGEFDRDKDPNFIPDDDERSEILALRDEIEEELRAEDADGWGDDLNGVEGGVAGGVVGGVVGGAMGGAVAPDRSVRSSPERTLDGIPAGRSYQSAVDAESTSGRMSIKARNPRSGARGIGRGGGGRGRTRGSTAGKKRKPKPNNQPPAPEAAPAETESTVAYGSADGTVDFEDIAIDGDLVKPQGNYALEPLEVTSTRLSVVVPVLGETLRFQHLLLPAGQSHSVHVEARADNTVPRRLP